MFVRDAEASNDGIFRVDHSHAIALFHHRRSGTDDVDTLPLWAALVDFSDPSAVVFGARARVIGDEPVHRARVDQEGVVFAILPRTSRIIEIRRVRE